MDGLIEQVVHDETIPWCHAHFTRLEGWDLRKRCPGRYLSVRRSNEQPNTCVKRGREELGGSP